MQKNKSIQLKLIYLFVFKKYRKMSYLCINFYLIIFLQNGQSFVNLFTLILEIFFHKKNNFLKV